MGETHSDLSYDEVKKFLTFSDEQLIVAKRQHPYVLVSQIFFASFIAFLLILFFYFPANFLFKSFDLFIVTSLLILTLLSSLITKIAVDAYFHLYIVTNRKILEVICRPFFTDTINDVFLDQVRTTEIDVKMNGMVNEILNMGDVVIAFDRPSHDKEFILKDISDPRGTGNLISEELVSMMHASPIWFQPRETSGDIKKSHSPHNHQHYDDILEDENNLIGA